MSPLVTRWRHPLTRRRFRVPIHKVDDCEPLHLRMMLHKARMTDLFFFFSICFQLPSVLTLPCQCTPRSASPTTRGQRAPFSLTPATKATSFSGKPLNRRIRRSRHCIRGLMQGFSDGGWRFNSWEICYANWGRFVTPTCSHLEGNPLPKGYTCKLRVETA